MLSGLFAGLALLLAALGLSGMTAYAVTRRRAEIGLRLALGARPASIVWVAVARVSFLVAIGVAIGILASLGLSQSVAALLYGLKPQDPGMLAGATVMLMTVAALASGWPAWRASRIDPAIVLREP
jgi:putative ABC transport system permease protein